MTEQLGATGIGPARSLRCRVLPGGNLVAVAAAMALTGLVMSCDNPTRPTTTGGTAAVVSGTAAVVSLVVTGPTSIAPGESAQFSAVAHKADGTSEDLTGRVKWESSNPAVATVSPTGLVTGVTLGECNLEVSYAGTYGQPADLLVVPPGTYRLTGQVTDAGLGSTIPVPDAHIEVVAGVGRGLSAVTDPGGGYALFGVAGNLGVRVTKDGYRTEDRQLVVKGSDQNLDIAMTPLEAYQRVSGRYRLTITAGSCETGGTPLPDQVKQRTYLAVVSQTGGLLHVALGDPGTGTFEGFMPGANAFDGFLQPDRVTFQLSGFDPYYFYPTAHLNLVERVSSWWLLISGSVGADIGRDSISGLLDGTMELFPVTLSLPSRRAFAQAECIAHDTRFVMAKK
jgi:hypothetical protein